MSAKLTSRNRLTFDGRQAVSRTRVVLFEKSGGEKVAEPGKKA